MILRWYKKKFYMHGGDIMHNTVFRSTRGYLLDSDIGQI